MCVLVFLVVSVITTGTKGAHVLTKPVATSASSAAAAVVPNNNDEEYPYNNIMLPGDLHPLKYHLLLHPNVTHTLDYTGHVKIMFQVVKETSDIILHSLDINHYDTLVQEVEKSTDSWEDVKYNTSNNIQVVKTLKSTKLEQAMVRLASKLEVGKHYVLEIFFSAPLRDVLRGFYKSSHVTPQGVKKYIATSHFEPTGARLAFPCF